MKDADTHTHTVKTHKDMDPHDLVTDKCSRFTGSQSNQIISKRLSGPAMLFSPCGTALSAVATGYEEYATIWEQ